MRTLQRLFLVQMALGSSIALSQDVTSRDAAPGTVDLPQGKSLSGDQVIPSADAAKKTELPGDKVIPNYPVVDPLVRENLERARETYKRLREKAAVDTQAPAVAEAPLTDQGSPRDASRGAPDQLPPPGTAVTLPKEPVAPQLVLPPNPQTEKPRRSWTRLPTPKAKDDGFRDEVGGVRVFTRNLQAGKKAGKDTFTLPSTSIALATLLYGVEATSTEERMVPAELNYAWLGPNSAVVEMKNCRLWVKVKGDYSTERIYGKAETISCRSPSGETFDIAVSAYMVDKEEEYLGARGELVARGKALASALSFLSNGVQAFGNAMASAQVQTDVASGSPYGGPVKGSNVGGDKNKYVAGQTVAGSTAKFLDWWINYYQSLSPTIAIGPGKKIYLAVEGTVEIPKIFFGRSIDQSQVDGAVQGWRAAETKGAKVNTTKSITRVAPVAPEGDDK